MSTDLCRQCGGVVERDRERWATPVCHACFPPPVPRSPCTEACRARVECVRCGLIKAPRGRSVAPEASNGMCGWDCPGYREDPQPGHLWPDEPLESD